MVLRPFSYFLYRFRKLYIEGADVRAREGLEIPLRVPIKGCYKGLCAQTSRAIQFCGALWS